MKFKVLIAVMASVLAQPAAAEWYKAESDHFVIYADDQEADVHRFAEMLERYHRALEAATGYKTEKPSPSNRVTVYTVGTARDVQQLAGGSSKFLQGFYVPRAAGSAAFVPDLSSVRGEPDPPMITLLHEYTHHFLISSQRYAMPRWVSEGAAEFYSSARFLADGGVSLGRPNTMRGGELYFEQKVSMEELFDDALYAKRAKTVYDSFYGQAWLLYHYLVFSPERKGQLNTYLQAVARGTPSLEAAKTVFGDLEKLRSELHGYLRAKRLMLFNVSAAAVQPGPIAVSRISAPLAAMLPVIVRSRRGVNSESAAAVLADARKIGGQYPGDAQVQAALAEAEFDAGNNAEAIAAADRAIAIDPGAKNAYVQKGFALFSEAADAPSDDRERAYRDAMVPFSALNAIENDHPLPLMYFYRSFVERGEQPSEIARDALARASELAPFDFGLAFETGAMLAASGKPALAIQVLKPVAANPHGGELAAQARAFLDQLADQPEGAVVHFVALPKPVVDGEAGAP